MDEPFSGSITLDDVVARIRAHPLGDDPPTQRSNFSQLTLAGGTSHDRNVDIASVDGTNGTIIYFHGGGYAFGSPATHSRICAGLANRTGLRVLAPSYPLAPEHCWPAQLDAALETSADVSGPIVLAGDSAGGHLALVTALEMVRRGRHVEGLVLFSPNTDRSGLSTTREKNDPLDPMVDDAGDRQLARQCFGDLSVNDPQVSPVLDDLTELPPLHVEVGAHEVLLGDSLVLARRAETAGRPVNLHVAANGLHMGQLWTPWWSEASASLDRAATFVRGLMDRRDISQIDSME